MRAPRTVDEELEQVRAALAARLVVTDSVLEGAAASGTSGSAARRSQRGGEAWQPYGYVVPSWPVGYSARALAAGQRSPAVRPVRSAGTGLWLFGPNWGIAADRFGRAAQAGYWGAQKAAGLIEIVPPTPSLIGFPPANRCFVLLVGRFDELSGYFPGPYAQFKDYVEDPATGIVASYVVFHGFASQAEARAYWAGAGREQPWRLLPPQLA